LNFFAYLVLLNINPLYQVKLFNKINLMVPSLPNYNSNEINDIVSGKYLLGGNVYSTTKGNILQKQILLFRDGVNDGTYVEKKSNNK